MKKFIATAPLQRPKSEKACYRAIDNSKLVYDKPVDYPVLHIINGYLEAGDEMEAIILTTDRIGKKKQNILEENENILSPVEENFQRMEKEIQELCEKRNAICKNITRIHIPDDELIQTHLNTFQKLISCFHNDDILYACMTYGTKPVPIVQLMALNYAYRALNNVTIECICYGALDHDTKEKRIFDITALFLMDQIVNELAKIRDDNPVEVIRQILDVEEE